LDAGEYLVIFRASTFHGAWCAGGIIRSDLNNIRFAWSNGLTRFQALAGASGQGHPLIVLIDVITIDQPDTVRVQVSGLCVGDPYSQAYHGSFIVAKLK
jgi:hypothetical protein